MVLKLGAAMLLINQMTSYCLFLESLLRSEFNDLNWSALGATTRRIRGVRHDSESRRSPQESYKESRNQRILSWNQLEN